MSWKDTLPDSAGFLAVQLEELQEGLWLELDAQGQADLVATFDDARTLLQLRTEALLGSVDAAGLIANAEEWGEIRAQMAQWRHQVKARGELLSQGFLQAVLNFATVIAEELASYVGIALGKLAKGALAEALE